MPNQNEKKYCIIKPSFSINQSAISSGWSRGRSGHKVYSSRQTRFSSYVHGKPSNGNRKKCIFLVFKRLYSISSRFPLVFTSVFLKLRIIIPNFLINHPDKIVHDMDSYFVGTPFDVYIQSNCHAYQPNLWLVPSPSSLDSCARKGRVSQIQTNFFKFFYIVLYIIDYLLEAVSTGML